MTGSRLISTTQDFQKLQSECISGVVSPPLRVHYDVEYGSLWVTTDGASITISSLLPLQELSPSQQQWLLQWIFSAKFQELCLDPTSLLGQPLYPLLPHQLNRLTLMET